MTAPDSSSTPPPPPESSPPSAQPSAAEERPAARIGGVLFRNRSWLPVPFLLVAVIAPSTTHGINWLIGGVLVIVGEWIRLAGVAAAGPVTRRRSRQVQRFVDYGAFAWVRNPLYVGNFLVWMGFVVISGVLWFLPVAVLLFALEYSLIVAYEEGVLESIFGQQYLDYKRSTPRWLPRPPKERKSGEHHWGEAWRSERSTFIAYAALVVIFAIKQKIWWQ